MADRVLIEHRFRGPASSGNGGYSCGVLGVLTGGPAEVTLRAPPPLDVPLAVVAAGARLELRHGEALIAEAIPGAKEVVVPDPVSFAEAEEATKGYPYATGHPYPECFVCGPARHAGDGLCIFPGGVRGRALAAAPWRPDASLAGPDGRVREEIVWAALDCPSWFGVAAVREFSGLILLGRLAARVVERPRPGDRCVAMGWELATDGRKIRCGSAVVAEDGRLLGVAEATWIQLR
jgi:hypothetical protein